MPTVATITNLTGATTLGSPCSVSLHCTTSTFNAGSWMTARLSWDMGDGTTREGFCVSHVYETPGSYTVTLTITAEDGTSDSDTLGLTVNAYTPGTITYVSGAGSDTTGDGSIGNPYRTLQKACSVQSGTGANKAIYLARGSTYTLDLIPGDDSRRTVLPTNWSGTAAQPFVIAAYGSGARPIVSAPVKNGPDVPFSVFNQFQTLDHWRVVDVDFLGPYVWGQPSELRLGVAFGGSRQSQGLWLRCVFRNWWIGYGAGSTPTNWLVGNTVKDCEFRDNADTHIYSEWHDGLSLTGCTMGRVFASHMMRLPFIQHYYGSGNTWRDGSDQRTTMKFHGGVWESAPNVFTMQGARWVWVKGDICYPKSESNAVVFSVHNFAAGQKHTLEDGCFEDMQFLTDSTNLAYTSKACFEISARRVVVRNNECSFDTGAAGNGFMAFIRLHGYPYSDTSLNPRDITIANNSVYMRNGGGSNMWNALLAFGDVNGPGTTGDPVENVYLRNNAFHVVGSWTATGMVSRDVNNSVAAQFEHVTEQNNISSGPANQWAYFRNLATLYTLGTTWDALAGGDKGTGSIAATVPGFTNGQAGDFSITTASAAYTLGRDVAEVRTDRDGRLRLLDASSRSDAGSRHLESERLPGDAVAFRLIDETVSMTWADRCANEGGYQIERAPDVAGVPGSWATIHTTAANAVSYVDSPGAGYHHYRLRAVRHGVASAGSSTVANTLTWPKSKRAGMNPHALDYINDGMDALKDIMLRGDGPWLNAGSYPWDEPHLWASYFRYDGYPHTMPPGRTVLVQLPPFGPDTWKVFFDGAGTLLLWWGHSGGTADSGAFTASGTTVVVPHTQLVFNLEILATNSADPVRNVRIVRASDEATYATAPWRESYVALHRHVQVVRCLDLMASNDTVIGTLDPHLWVQLKPAPLAERSFGDANTKYAWIAPGGGMGNPADGSIVRGETSDLSGVIRATSRYWEVDTNWAAIVVPSTADGTAPERLFAPGERVVMEDGTYAYISDPMVCMPYAPALPQCGTRELPSPPNASYYVRFWLGMARLAQLCNAIDADMWVTIPMATSDDLIRSIAQDVANNLDGRRLLYVEYSNEVFHSGFSHYNHLEGLRRLRGSAAVGIEALRETARCVDLCRQHLTPERVRGVQSWGAYSPYAPDDIDAYVTQSWNGSTFLSRLYAYAIAPYYGSTHSYTTVAQIHTATTTFSLPGAEAVTIAWQAAATARGIRLLAYEGGCTWAGNGTPTVQQATYDYHRTGSYQDATDYLAAWATNTGAALFNWFTDIHRNRNNENDQWGLGANVADTATDKWNAWRDYIESTFPPQPTGLSATVLSAQSIRLDWSVTGWQSDAQTLVERSPGPNGPWQVVATVAYPTATYTDDLLAGDATYWYRVATDDPRGRSAYAPVASATTQGADVQITTGPWALCYPVVESATVSVGLSTPIVAQTVQCRSSIPTGWTITVAGGGVTMPMQTLQCRSSIPGGWPVTLSPLPPVTPTMQTVQTKARIPGGWPLTISGGGVNIVAQNVQSRVAFAGTWSLTAGGVTISWAGPLVNYVHVQGASMSFGLLPSGQTKDVTRKINSIYRGLFLKDPQQVIWLGQAVGFHLGGARVLQGTDQFLGFATGKSAIGDPDVWVAQVGTVEIDVEGVTGPSANGAPVYALNDTTFTVAPGGPLIGRVSKHISGRRCSVVFRSFYF